MKNIINYIESEDGLQIPEIRTPNLSGIGKYGLVFKSYLKEKNGCKYARLIRKGELEKYLKELNEAATNKITKFVEEEFYKSDYAKSEDFMLIYQEKESLKKSAEELVISDMISQL